VCLQYPARRRARRKDVFLSSPRVRSSRPGPNSPTLAFKARPGLKIQEFPCHRFESDTVPSAPLAQLGKSKERRPLRKVCTQARRKPSRPRSAGRPAQFVVFSAHSGGRRGNSRWTPGTHVLSRHDPRPSLLRPPHGPASRAPALRVLSGFTSKPRPYCVSPSGTRASDALSSRWVGRSADHFFPGLRPASITRISRDARRPAAPARWRLICSVSFASS
jgi:hypothetical protein